MQIIIAKLQYNLMSFNKTMKINKKTCTSGHFIHCHKNEIQSLPHRKVYFK